MSIFPGAISSFAGFTSSHTLAADSHASQHNSEQAEIIAAQTKIGTGSSTPASGMLLRGNGVGTSAWSQVGLTTDVSGVLPVANGGTGTTLLTFPTSSDTLVGRNTTDTLANKTLTTPTIASFVNANHDHTNSAGGGTLGASTVGSSQIIDNSIAFGDLLSTIFSGQVTSDTNPGTAGGSRNYLTLGGIKIAWGVTASSGAIATNGNLTLGVTLPLTYTSTSTMSPVACSNTPSGDARMLGYVAAYSTSAITVGYQSLNAGSASLTASWFVIGT